MATQYINDDDIEVLGTNVSLGGATVNGTFVPDGLVVGRAGYVGQHGRQVAVTATSADGHFITVAGIVHAAGADAIDLGSISDFNRITVMDGGAVSSAGGRAIDARGDDNTLVVDGAVSGKLNGVVMGDGATVLVGAGGSVVSGSTSVDLAGTSSLTNAGSITSRSSDGAQVSTIVNTGTITGFAGGVFVTDFLDNAGTITATGTGGPATGVIASSGGTTVINSGSIGGVLGIAVITGADTRIVNTGIVASRDKGITIEANDALDENTLVNAGEIVGGATAVEIQSGNARIVNTGLMEGGSAIELRTLSSALDRGATIHNEGTLAGTTDAAVGFSSGSQTVQSVSLTNTGTIVGRGANSFDTQIGTGLDAIVLSGGDDRVVNSGTILGNVKLGSGNDVFYGTKGSVAGFVNAGSGNDRLLGGEGDDVLRGGLGDDYLRASGGQDVLDGGGGRLVGGPGLTLASTRGSDTASFITVRDAVEIDLLADTAAGGAAGTRLIDIENLEGTTANDKLFGDDARNILTGFAGRDTLFGGNNTDTLLGGSGDDALFGGQDDDLLRGGTGADTLNGGAGTDTADFGDLGTGVTVVLGGTVSTGDTLASIENLLGTRFDDVLGGDAKANALTGGDGEDVLFSGGGDDRLTGGRDSDTLFGGAGDDVFVFADDFVNGGFVGVSRLNFDTIKDFQNGRDLIDISDFAFTDGIGADDDVATQAQSFVQVGADVEIVLTAGNKLIIEGRDVADITDADFVF